MRSTPRSTLRSTLRSTCLAVLLGSLASAATACAATAPDPATPIVTTSPTTTPATTPTPMPAADGTRDERDVLIEPRALDRGPDVAVPHLEGRRIVDGDVRLRVLGDYPELLGRAGDGYVLRIQRDDRVQVVRVTAVSDGAEQRVLVEGAPRQAVLSQDGTTLATAGRFRGRSATLEVRDATDGELLASRSGFTNFPNLGDVDAEHVLVTSGTRLIDWSWRDDAVTTVVEERVYQVDIAADRIVYLTSGRSDSCSVVARLTRPSAELWRSCDEEVAAFSPDGRRIATIDAQYGVLGPDRVWERTVRGEQLASYRVGRVFDAISWETDTDLLLEALDRRRGATVRCSEGSCERASALR